MHSIVTHSAQYHPSPGRRRPNPLSSAHRFKAFLDGVTPQEWFESLAATRGASKAALRASWQAECDAVAAHKAEAATERQRAEHDMKWARTQQQYERAERAYREALGTLREALALTVRACLTACGKQSVCWPTSCIFW